MMPGSMSSPLSIVSIVRSCSLLELVELVLELADDLADLVADRRGIDIDVIVDGASLRSRVLVILRLAGMMISPVSPLTTSSGIFSPRRMLESASVSCSCSSSFCFL